MISIYILDKPNCKTDRQPTLAVSPDELIDVKCSVNANPPENIKFHWALNISSDITSISSKHYNYQGTASQLFYSIRRNFDYCMLLCWAENDIGQQTIPCRYHVVKASK